MLAVAITVLGAVALSFGLRLPSCRPSRAEHLPPASAEGATRLARVPVAFVPNLGQWAHPARFVARLGATTVFLEERGWTFTRVDRSQANDGEKARGVAVRMTFAGAGEPELVAEDPLPGRHNYFLGNDPSKWRSDVPLYRAVRYREVHPGVDVRAREQGGHFEYDLVLQPDADLEPVEVAVEGIERLHVDRDGALVLETRLGSVRMPAPLSWEAGPLGQRTPITCRYVVRGERRFGFEAMGRRPGWALTIDPGLVWSTYLGGNDEDSATGIALDTHGAATVVGASLSLDFPTTPGAFDTTRTGPSDAIVTRLSPNGSSLVYATFLGGSDIDYLRAISLDAQGAATVAGASLSRDFPTTPGAFDRSYGGGSSHGDAFVARLSPTGASLVYSTYLGGGREDVAIAVALDALGAATIAGWSQSNDYPTTPGAFDTSHNNFNDGVVTRLSPTGASLVYSTFLGGTGYESLSALGLDAQGAATVVGSTSSTDYPTTPGAFDTSQNGGDDAFVTRLSPTGASLVYSTFLGGIGNEWCWALGQDAQGAVTVAGITESANFPTTPGALDHSLDGGKDAYVTRLSPTGATLVYSTFLGGGGTLDAVHTLVLDAQGAATVAGLTKSTDFPTTPGAFDTNHNGVDDAFVARLSPTGSSLLYSTFLGGAGIDYVHALCLDAQGAATVAGITASSNFPTTPGAFDTSYNGGLYYGDAFVTRLDLLPTGAAAFGRSSPGCTGPLAISVTSMPRTGNANFALTCGNAPQSAPGVLVLAAAGLTTPIPLLGVEVWLDPFRGFFLGFSASSNSMGASGFALPIPNDPTLFGLKLAAQFFWGGPTSPPPCPPLGLSASNALDITIQP